MAQSVAERFWAKVRKSDGCWEWTGSRLNPPRRYGLFWNGKRNVTAHRFAWELEHGPVPVGLDVCHSCDNASCVRVDHLFVGTRSDNMRDCAQKRRLHNQRNPEDASTRKLTAEQVRELRQRENVCYAAVGRELGLHPTSVRDAYLGITWKHLVGANTPQPEGSSGD